jgi:hypothetical protein
MEGDRRALPGIRFAAFREQCGQLASKANFESYNPKMDATLSPHRFSLSTAGMSYEIAKLLLEHADTFLQRADAVKSAMALGMPIHEIGEYLDWLDETRQQRAQVLDDPGVSPGTPGCPT